MSTRTRNPAETKRKLIEASVHLMLRQGYSATTVDQVCAAAGMTKGSFFHYFKSKEDIGLAALECWGNFGTEAYAPACTNTELTAVEKLHALLDIMSNLARGEEPLACLVGMVSQEMWSTNATLRDAGAQHLTVWTEMVHEILEQAKADCPHATDFSASEVAWFLNSIWQGSMLIAKARQDPQMTVDNLAHARAYVDDLLGVQRTTIPTPAAA